MVNAALSQVLASGTIILLFQYYSEKNASHSCCFCIHFLLFDFYGSQLCIQSNDGVISCINVIKECLLSTSISLMRNLEHLVKVDNEHKFI